MPPRVVLRSRAASSTPEVGSFPTEVSERCLSSSPTSAARLSRSVQVWSACDRAAYGLSLPFGLFLFYGRCSAVLLGCRCFLRFCERLFRDQLAVPGVEKRSEVVLPGNAEVRHVVGHGLGHLARHVMEEEDLKRCADGVREGAAAFSAVLPRAVEK